MVTLIAIVKTEFVKFSPNKVCLQRRPDRLVTLDTMKSVCALYAVYTLKAEQAETFFSLKVPEN